MNYCDECGSRLFCLWYELWLGYSFMGAQCLCDACADEAEDAGYTLILEGWDD